MIICPTREKFQQTNDPPFSLLYGTLKQNLTSRILRLCIVIGYSFRDEIINQIFRTAIKRGLKLLVIDNNAKAANKNLLEVFNTKYVRVPWRVEEIKFGNWVAPYKERLAKVLDEELGSVFSKASNSASNPD